MRTALVICLAGYLVGCVATSAPLFQLSSNDHWDGYGSSCSGPLGKYVRTLANGVDIQLGVGVRGGRTVVGLSLILADGASVSLADREILVTMPDGSTKHQSIEQFRSGFPGGDPPRPGGPPLVEYQIVSASEKLEGHGRFSKVPKGYILGNGGDQFVALVDIGSGTVERFAMSLPTFQIDGRLIRPSDVTFAYGPVKFIQCIQ